jgi:hypothetical protein
LPYRPWALVLVTLLAACGAQLTVEQQIIAVIREMEVKIEAGERRPFMAYLAEDFSAQNGSMNRDQVGAFLLMQLNRYKRLQGQLFPIHVEETGDATASARFKALVTGGPGWLPESGQVFEFETQWVRRDGEWLLLAADWTPKTIDEVL